MNRKNILIIFVDAFPYLLLNQDKFFLNTFEHCTAIQPGFGFSINVYPEMFAGLKPDDLGFLNNWQLVQSSETNPYFCSTYAPTRIARRTVDLLTRRPQAFSRFLHKFYEKTKGYGNIANIPFEYLPFFRRGSSSKTIKYIYNELNLRVIQHNQIEGSVWDRDMKAFQQALEGINQGDSLFVSFGSLDYAGHRWGPHSDRFIEQAHLFDKWCQRLIDIFIALHPKNHQLVICSDHGMAEVKKSVTLKLEKEFGKPSPHNYLYFLEANMARIWIRSDEIKKKMLEFLRKRPEGNVIDSAKRDCYGIRNRDFGDIIFVLDEGNILWPGWYGGWIPKGMHGYLPETPSQQAIFLYQHAPKNEEKLPKIPKKGRDLFHFWKQTLQ